MKNASPKVDEYIANAADFAQPILTRIRQAFHKACPDIQETMKWSMPHFEYKGIVGSMAAFMAHVSFGFWKAKLMNDPIGLFRNVRQSGMNAQKISKVSELPSRKVLVAYVREAVALNEHGVRAPAMKKKTTSKALTVPDDLAAALKKSKKAQKTFENFSPSHKREYIEWITEAKQDATRERRLKQAIEWMAERKPRNWKYM